MNIFQIALSNLKRRKIKMTFLVIGLLVGVSTVISLFSIVKAMRIELGNELDAFGPNIVIVPRSEGLDLDYGGTQVSKVSYDVKLLTESVIPVIRTIPDGDSINIISPKLVGAVTLNSRKALIVGVETKNEFTMKPWMSLKETGDAATAGEMTDLALLTLPDDGLILGAGIARTYHVSAGDKMTVNGKDFKVAGILNELGTDEDGLAYANLKIVQELLKRPGEFSMIEVSGFCNFCPIEDMTQQLSDVLPDGRVTALRQAALVREETIDRFSTYGFALSGVTLLIAALVVMTTMLSSVNERTREIGIFRAIGFRRIHIIEIIVIEALVVSLIAGIAGFIAGGLIAQNAGSFLAQMKVTIPWDASMIAPAIMLSIAVAVISSIYPAIKAANLDPVEALRFI
ncbi:MAG: ABC transporter permease [Saccharofermentanales bacterium]